MTSTVRGRIWALLWVAAIALVGLKFRDPNASASTEVALPRAVASSPLQNREAPAPTSRIGRFTRTIRGRVVNSTGIPLPGAKVRWESTRFIRVGMPGWVDIAASADQCTTVGRDGRFEFAVPYLDDIQVMAEHDNYAPSCVQAEGRLESQSEIRLGAALSLTGEVVDAGSQVPIEGASVTVHDDFRFVTRETWTDSSGRYRITNLADGPIRVNIEGPGHVPAFYDFSLSNATAVQDAQLNVGLSCQVQVVSSETSSPIQNAGIIVGRRTVLTDENGMATIAGIAPEVTGFPHRFRVFARDHVGGDLYVER